MVEGDCDEVRDTQSCGRKLSVRCDASSFFLLSLLSSTSVSENIKSGGKNQKYARGLWCQHAGPVRLTPAHIRKHWVSAFTRSVDAAKKRAQDWFRVYQITHCTGRNPPNVKSRCCCFQCERRLKGPRDAFVFGRLGSPLRSLSLAALRWQPWFFSLPVFFSKPFSILSPLQAFRWVLPRPPHKTDFGFSNNLSPAVVRAGGQILDFSNHTEYKQCKDPILTFLFSHWRLYRGGFARLMILKEQHIGPLFTASHLNALRQRRSMPVKSLLHDMGHLNCETFILEGEIPGGSVMHRTTNASLHKQFRHFIATWMIRRRQSWQTKQL